MIEVLTHIDSSGDECVDQWDAPRITFMTEPSGVLVVFKSPNVVWAAYAPGRWMKVREVDGRPI